MYYYLTADPVIGVKGKSYVTRSLSHLGDWRECSRQPGTATLRLSGDLLDRLDDI